MRNVCITQPRAYQLIVQGLARNGDDVAAPRIATVPSTNEYLPLKHYVLYNIIYLYTVYLRASKIKSSRTFSKRNLFFQTLYYFRILSIDGLKLQRFDGSCFDFRTFSLLNIFFAHLNSCARSHFPTHVFS